MATWRQATRAREDAESRELCALRCARTLADALRESVAAGGAVSERTHERLDRARARLARMGVRTEGL